ncbi:MAG: glycoside hydrolase family 43 protein [Cyclobacteriaceae bacterium]
MTRNHLLFSLLLIVFFGCAQPEESSHPEPVPSKALFDSFTYTGQDEFYIENELTSEDEFYNPILPGWYSDPSICTDGENYFLVTSSFSYFPGVPLFHSTDLVNWKQIGHVLTREEQLPLEGQQISQGIFAPAISYNPHNQTYYMITTNITRGNFLVKTKDPFGEWSDPVWLPDVKGIDPSLFFDDDGSAYIVNNEEPVGGSTYEGHRAIWVHQFDPSTDSTFGEKKMIINGGVNLDEKPIWIEGPHIYKINGQYMLMCAEGGTSVNHREVIFTSDSPMGEYTPWEGNPILTQRHLDPDREKPITCAGHADLVQSAEGDWWGIFLACRPIENKFENLGRETFLMPLRWSEDSIPYLTKDDELIPRIVKREGVTRSSEVTYGNFTRSYDFDTTQLPPEWLTLRTPGTDLYSLTDYPGYLELNCADVSATERKTPALLSRRLQHHEFELSTELIFEPSGDEAAGLLMVKDETHQYFFGVRMNGENKEAVVVKVTEDGSEVLGNQQLEGSGDMIDLRITSDGKVFNFAFAQNGGEWNSVADGVDAYYLSTASSWGFTGTMVGMYATSKPF